VTIDYASLIRREWAALDEVRARPKTIENLWLASCIGRCLEELRKARHGEYVRVKREATSGMIESARRRSAPLSRPSLNWTFRDALRDANPLVARARRLGSETAQPAWS
jgi:hypothetical protein